MGAPYLSTLGHVVFLQFLCFGLGAVFGALLALLAGGVRYVRQKEREDDDSGRYPQVPEQPPRCKKCGQEFPYLEP